MGRRLSNHRLSERAESARPESVDELLDVHVVLPHIALPTGEDAVVPVVSAALGQGCDVLNGGPYRVVLSAGDSLEHHDHVAVTASVAEELAQSCVCDDFGARMASDSRPALMVVVCCQRDAFGTVTAVAVHVVESDLLVVAEECCTVAFELHIVVCLVPGGNLCASAGLALGPVALACALIAVILIERFAIPAGRALSRSVGVVHGASDDWPPVAPERVAVVAVAAVVGIAISLCKTWLIAPFDRAGLAPFNRPQFLVVSAAEAAAVSVVAALLFRAHFSGVDHVFQFAAGVRQ